MALFISLVAAATIYLEQCRDTFLAKSCSGSFSSKRSYFTASHSWLNLIVRDESDDWPERRMHFGVQADDDNSLAPETQATFILLAIEV